MPMILDGLGWPAGTAGQIANMADDQAVLLPDHRHVQIKTRGRNTHKPGFVVVKPDHDFMSHSGGCLFDVDTLEKHHKGRRVTCETAHTYIPSSGVFGAYSTVCHCETGPARVFYGMYSRALVVEFWLNGKFIRGLPAQMAQKCSVRETDSYPHYRFVTLDGYTPIEWTPEGFDLMAQMHVLAEMPVDTTGSPR